MKNAFHGSSRIEIAKERFSELEEITTESFKTQMQTEKQTKNSQVILNSYRRLNIHIMGIPQGRKRERRAKEIFETIMFRHFSPN